jgi:hypothetical protein
MLVLYTCSSPTELKIQETYTPLSIGDQTQIINLSDNSTFCFLSWELRQEMMEKMYILALMNIQWYSIH